MLRIDISLSHLGEVYTFKAEICEGQRHVFEIGERMLADRLFAVLCGLDKDFKGVLKGGGVVWSLNKDNNVLALGEGTMFIKGSVHKNIYKAIRARTGRADAKTKTDEVIKLYGLSEYAEKNIFSLFKEDGSGNDLLFRTALARAHFRDIKLVVANCFETYAENNFTKPNAPYIIEIR